MYKFILEELLDVMPVAFFVFVLSFVFGAIWYDSKIKATIVKDCMSIGLAKIDDKYFICRPRTDQDQCTITQQGEACKWSSSEKEQTK